MIREVAPAKVNLYLHVGGRRRDGLHDLDSVFFFLDAGDLVSAEEDDALSLTLTGPFAGPLRREPIARNLVYRAAALLRQESGIQRGARLALDKRLPIASGVGGGSADAAAALRALVRLWRVSISADDLRRLAFRLGADVPACLERRPVRVSGAGELLEPAPAMPPLWACLVNPRKPMPTGPVFRAFDAAIPDPAPPHRPALRPLTSFADVERVMRESRNDLQPFAIARHSVVQEVVDRLGCRPGAAGARMSGSGATVFALFSSGAAAHRASVAMAGRGWWSIDAAVMRA